MEDYKELLLDLLVRVQKLEKEVCALKGAAKEKSAIQSQIYQNPRASLDIKTRDTSRYMYNGGIYLKNKLVLRIVCDYVKQHNPITQAELKRVFEKSLQGSIGVVENVDIAKQRFDYEKRFFIRDNEILHLSDGDMYVCNQWGVLNIPNFIARAKQLGMEIEKIN